MLLSSLFVLLFHISMGNEFNLQQEKSEYKNINILGDWHINRIEIDGQMVIFPQNISSIDIHIAEDRISGNAGCNIFMLPYSLHDNQINIQDGGLTRRMCEMDLVKFENAFLQIFHGTFSIQKSFGNIILIGDKATIYITK